MNKRGISAVVATVLIILITVAGVTIIWGAIIPMIRDNLDFSALEGRVYVVTSGGYTFYDASTGLAKVQVKRDMDDGVMNRIKIDFSIDGNSVSSSVVAPDPGNTKVYVFDLSGYGEPESVSVAPIFVSGSGKEKIGSVTSNVKIGSGNIGSYGFVYDAGKEYSFDIADGLVSWWRFEGNANDEVGDNDGSLQGNVDCSVGGKYGKACSFDGISGYFRKNNFTIGNQKQRTFSAWINPNSDSTSESIFSLTADSNNYKWSEFFYSLGNGLNFMFGDNTYYNERGNTSSIIPLNKWSYVTVTIDITQSVGNRVKIYYNGQSQSFTYLDDDGNLIYDGTDLNLQIGAAHHGTLQAFFNGEIDEVMIFNRALTAEEVKALYEMDLG